jgi:hypothetical protein
MSYSGITPEELINLNLFGPTGNEVVSNPQFVAGEKNIGGITEGVVNGIPKKSLGCNQINYKTLIECQNK